MSLTQRPKIYSLLRLPEEIKAILQENYDVLVAKERWPSQQDMLQDVAGAHVIICRTSINVNKEIIEAAGPLLKVICTFSAGYNHIDLVECKKRNIRIGYLSQLIAGCMAEFTVGFMIQTARRFKEQMAEIKRGGWATFHTKCLLGCDLSDSTVGIVGLGNIGQEVVKRIKAFGLKKILYSGPRRKKEGDVLAIEYTTLNELLQQSDFVISTCALNEQTKKMFNRDTFNLMKPSSIFINVSRGGVVDQEALHEALITKKIFGAGLDVTTPEPLPKDHPLNTLENCIVMPHIGTCTHTLRIQMYEMTIDNICAGLTGVPMPDELFY